MTKGQNIEYRGGNVNFYPGYMTSACQINKSTYLTVAIKNKFIQTKYSDRTF